METRMQQNFKINTLNITYSFKTTCSQQKQKLQVCKENADTIGKNPRLKKVIK